MDMKCNTCNTEFTAMPMMEETEQAAGCAATLYLKDRDYYILGHFGSMQYDMQLYALKKGGHYEVGNICDDCITKLINEGSASLIEDGVW